MGDAGGVVDKLVQAVNKALTEQATNPNRRWRRVATTKYLNLLLVD